MHTVPMIVDRGPNERVLGAMLFVWTSVQALDGETATLIAAVADQGALALERARLYTAERKARKAAEAAQAEAEQANAVKSQFLAVMSHELRTPLNAIGGYTELLEMGLRGPVNAQQLEDLRRIRRSQEHLLGLINALLNYAKLEAGQMDYAIERLSVADTVRAVDSLVAPLAIVHELRLTTSTCGEEATVLADAEKLRQILLNLLSNAMKFTAKGGSVRVTCERTGQSVEDRRIVLCVSDTGRGIAPAELQRIFDPFVQVGRTLTSTDAGTGLGLAISRDLARGMGGELTAKSEVGVGSEFRLELPAG
jgi:signal transduction histidine kinase